MYSFPNAFYPFMTTVTKIDGPCVTHHYQDLLTDLIVYSPGISGTDYNFQQYVTTRGKFPNNAILLQGRRFT